MGLIIENLSERSKPVSTLRWILLTRRVLPRSVCRLCRRRNSRHFVHRAAVRHGRDLVNIGRHHLLDVGSARRRRSCPTLFTPSFCPGYFKIAATCSERSTGLISESLADWYYPYISLGLPQLPFPPSHRPISHPTSLRFFCLQSSSAYHNGN